MVDITKLAPHERDMHLYLEFSSPEQLAVDLVKFIKLRYKESFIRNGGLLVGYMLRTLSSYTTSVRRSSIDEAKFNPRMKMETKLQLVWDEIFCRIGIHCDSIQNGDTRARRTALVVHLTCKELEGLVHKELSHFIKE